MEVTMTQNIELFITVNWMCVWFFLKCIRKNHIHNSIAYQTYCLINTIRPKINIVCCPSSDPPAKIAATQNILLLFSR